MSVFHKWGGGLDPQFPRIERAYDEFLVTDSGEEIVDAAAGAAVVNLGHSVDGAADVMAEQAEQVGYLTLSHFRHASPERLADTLGELTPAGLESAFFVNSGSEAVEAAMKLARAYHHERGNAEKSTVIGRWQSYHGSTLGALAVGGNTSRRSLYRPLLTNAPHIPPAYPYRWNYSGSPEEQATAAARELETLIRQEGPETVAAFIAEPISGASIPAARPHQAYFQEVRRICDDYDVLFVADEIMTGFGRTGSMFAVDAFDVVPDIMTLGKGLSGGYAPISATMVHDNVAMEFSAEGGTFQHGHTFSGNPLSTAVADHVARKYTPAIIDEGNRRGKQLADELDSLSTCPIVGDVRQVGLMVGIEFVADRTTKQPFDPALDVDRRVYEAALERGVYVYPGNGCVDGTRGDHIMLAPPLTTTVDSISTIAEATLSAIDAVSEELSGGGKR